MVTSVGAAGVSARALGDTEREPSRSWPAALNELLLDTPEPDEKTHRLLAPAPTAGRTRRVPQQLHPDLALFHDREHPLDRENVSTRTEELLAREREIGDVAHVFLPRLGGGEVPLEQARNL
ncbi:hypothetical protein ACH4C2_37750 [Streptomyces sp. NPDC018057]|uniref:hypothetical protein n=1 Tax=unclassified Streptomyces TaxID=2593676 RepID=UPI0037AACA97